MFEPLSVAAKENKKGMRLLNFELRSELALRAIH